MKSDFVSQKERSLAESATVQIARVIVWSKTDDEPARNCGSLLNERDDLVGPT
jgi:hypothetical protein